MHPGPFTINVSQFTIPHSCFPMSTTLTTLFVCTVLLNYVFGHRHSTILLSPYGLLSSLINHSPNKANTRIQWTTSPMRSPEWFEMDPEEWIMSTHSGLQWDFIALRDIEANEEILIDYGPEWEAAWKEHVRNWKKPPFADDYQAAYDLQRDLDGELPTEYYDKGIGEHIQVST
jgi:SET domain